MRKIFIFACTILFLSALAILQSPESGASVAHYIDWEENVQFVSTGDPRAGQVGMDILDQGGSAVDAVIASALASITLDTGLNKSFAGIFGMVHFDPITGRVDSLNACFKTVLDEDKPLTIPSGGIPNARAVMVPGFMAGVEQAHMKYGRLPWADLFKPAIEIAEKGFPVSLAQVNVIYNNWHILGVLPETRKIFLKRKYGLFRNYKPGDIFIQPELAHTLNQVALHGAAYMYTGGWGQKFVTTVRREGGKITLRDMREYDVCWADPAHTTYNGYDIHALGYPSNGAMSIIMGINLMEWADLANLGHCSNSADALYRLICCERVGEFFYPPYAPEIIKQHIPEGDFSYESRADKETARLIWKKIESKEWPEIEQHILSEGYEIPDHSEAIIARDAYGNVAAVCHTLNAKLWGSSGIFVDGVSVSAAGYFQQERISKAGAGQHLPDTTNPALVLKNGLPSIASSCIGSDLHSATVQNLYNLLNFDMTVSDSNETPKFQSVEGLSTKIKNGSFAESLIEDIRDMGLRIMLVDNNPRALWIGIRLTY